MDTHRARRGAIPTFRGIFTTDDELGVPFERPRAVRRPRAGDRRGVREREAQAARQAEADAEEFVAPRAAGGGRGGNRGGGGTGPPAHWLERGKPSRRTSIVIDPPDGRIPYLNDEARKRAAVAVNARTTGRRPFDGPQALDLYDRCITRGLPHVIFPTIYNNTSQIVQGPGYVAIRYEMIHDARVIPLDGGPQLSPDDPAVLRRLARPLGRRHAGRRGHQLPDEHGQLSRRRPAALHVTERFRRVDADTVRYEVTVADPTTFSRPWTAALSLQADADQPDVFEYACHEGNYAMRNILSGARAR